ncbi:MAG: hypothetical protein AAF703_00675 [Cyanobacteria bacterium P01_D01_bin.105]
MKYLPWSSLFQSAGLTVLVATAIDILLGMTLSFVPQLGRLLLGSPFLALVISLAVPFGVGALGIFFTRAFFRQVLLGTNTIWALVGCLLLALIIKNFLQLIPTLFLGGFSLQTIMMVAVGCFTTGKRHWRY